MDDTICAGCGFRVSPIKVFGQSPKSKQWWLITQCPRERCKFNIDIEPCAKPGTKPPSDKKKPESGNGGRSFWGYDMGV